MYVFQRLIAVRASNRLEKHQQQNNQPKKNTAAAEFVIDLDDWQFAVDMVNPQCSIETFISGWFTVILPRSVSPYK